MHTRRDVLISIGGTAIAGAAAAGLLFGIHKDNGDREIRTVLRDSDLVHEDGTPLLTEAGERLSWS